MSSRKRNEFKRKTKERKEVLVADDDVGKFN